MLTHDLARKLLEFPNLPVAVVSMGHLYSSVSHRTSHGRIQIKFIEGPNGKNRHITIGGDLWPPHPNDANWPIQEQLYEEPL